MSVNVSSSSTYLLNPNATAFTPTDSTLPLQPPSFVSFDASGMDAMKQQIATALRLPNTDDWGIYDEDPEHHLVLIHTHPDADLQTYGWIKGLILDTRTWRIVCQSFGNSTTVSLNMQRPVAPTTQWVIDRSTTPPSRKQKALFRVLTTEGEKLDLDSDTLTWVEGYDGTLVRVWKHDGNVYVSSHRCIHTDTASWGGSPSFRDLYASLGGATDTLFDPAVPTSRYVHTFLLVHPMLQIGSHFPIETPFMLYLGEHVLSVPKGTTTEEAEPDVAVFAAFRRPDIMDMDAVNKRLMYGFYPPEASPYLAQDPRTSHGEFVMCFEYTDATKTRIARCIRIQSDAYTWRVAMRDNTPSLEQLVFKLASAPLRDPRRRSDVYDFTNRYPCLQLPAPANDTVLPCLVPVLVPPSQALQNQKLTALSALVYATPPARQHEILTAYTAYVVAVETLKQWVNTIATMPSSDAEALFAKLSTEFGARGRHTAKRFRNILDVSAQRSERFKQPEILPQSVSYLLEHEYGESIYTMHRLLIKWDQFVASMITVSYA